MTEVLTEVSAWALRQPSVFRIGAVCDVEKHRFGSRIGEIRFRSRGLAAPMVAASEHQRRTARLL
jgi:hypothetical protein